MTENGSGPTGADSGATRALVEEVLNDGNGVLRLAPAFVARDLVPPGRRLGLAEEAYDLGERGFVCERWLGSTTRADNRIGPPDEGLGHVVDRNGRPRLTLRDAVRAAPTAIMGAEYAASHPEGLGRLAKLLDYGARIPYHIHPPQRFAELVGRRSKDEAYYFPAGVETGPHPETFFGVHPWIVRERAYDVLLPYLVDWDSDLILRHSRAYLQVPDDGFGVPSGVLHGPGTALTVELQEDSDVFAMFQALNAGRIISKELLFKDVRPQDRQAQGERFPLGFVEWELNGDPYLYEHNHVPPRAIEPADAADDGREWWIFYNTSKFSGKKLVVPPGRTHLSTERGVYSILVWSGEGRYCDHDVRGGDADRDELLVSHDVATVPHPVRNTGREDLVVFKFFGPGINDDAPVIPRVAPA